MRLLFLDIDGVLNDHKPQENGYCGIQPDKAARLNRILDAFPDLQIVVSSAWRYAVHNGLCTLAGLEHLLLTHGIKCHKRIHGVTAPDAEVFDPDEHEPPYDVETWKSRGLRWRVEQINDYCFLHEPDEYVILDDLPLAHSALVCTAEVETVNGVCVPKSVGLNDSHVEQVVRLLNGGEGA